LNQGLIFRIYKELQILNTPNENGYHQGNKQQMLARMGRRVRKGPLYTVGGNVNYSNHCGNQYEGSFKNERHNYYMILLYHTWAYIRRNGSHIKS
jgi:hypothetical protein